MLVLVVHTTRNNRHFLGLVRLEQRIVVLVPDSTGRLITIDVVTPPRAASPPEGAEPDVAVGLEGVEQARDGRLALVVGAARKLPDDADLAVGLEPLGRAGDALRADGARDARRRGPRAVRVEVLVHLVDDLVLRVRQGLEVVVDRRPGPGARVRVALDEDVLRGSPRGPDAVDGGLVQVQDESLVHVVVFVVGVEDDLGVALVHGGQVLPEGLEAGGVGDDVAVKPTKVVRVNDSIGSGIGDEVDRSGQVVEVCGCQGGRNRGTGNNPLHREGDPEAVVARADEGLVPGQF